MFENIPTVLTSQEILDKAFHKASKIEVEDPHPTYRLKKTNAQKLMSVGDIVHDTLMKYVRKFPSLDQLHPFHREMVHILVDSDTLRRSLAAAQWAAEESRKVCTDHQKRILRSRNRAEIASLLKEAYGRVSSVVKQIDRNLKYLGKARDILKRLPSVDTSVPTMVIAGPPNVGKSLLIGALTRASPTVASYPFTTKGIHVGHLEVKRERYQVIDTPGLLDRDLDTMNNIERQAVLALRYLSTVVVFMFDLSGGCGYPLSDQEGIYLRMRTEFKDIPFVPIRAKSDLDNLDGEEGLDRVRELSANEKRELPEISALTGAGLEELLSICTPILREGFLPAAGFEEH